MSKIFTNIIVTLFFICGYLTASVAEPTSESETLIKIGMLLPLSGSYSAFGTDARQGIEIALTELNLPRISLVFGDSRTEPIHALNEFRKMLNSDSVLAVFAFRGPIGMAVNPVSRSENISLLGGVGNKDFAIENKYAFQLWPPSDQEGKFVASHLVKIGAKRIAVVTAQDDWTNSVSIGFKNELKKLSKKIVLDEEFIPNELDFNSTITKLKLTKPDAIFVNLSLVQVGIFVSKVRQFGIDVPIISNFWINKPEVVDSIGAKNLEGVVFAEMSSNFPKLENDLKKQFGSKPSGATISAYVATMLLGQAAKEISAVPTRLEFYEKLLEIKKITTVNGNFIVKDRVVQFPMIMRKFHRGVATDLRIKNEIK